MHWLHTWSQRARELAALRGEAWRAGYGVAGPSLWARFAEAAIRVAELAGVGVLAQAVEWLLVRQRYRVLTAEEAAFAKTYFSPDLLHSVRIDERAALTAGRLGIAYVMGTFVKTAGPLSRAVLVHELVHVAQFRRWGWAYVVKALWAQHFGDGYHYGLTIASGEQLHNCLWQVPQHQLNAEQEAAPARRRGATAAGARRAVGTTDAGAGLTRL